MVQQLTPETKPEIIYPDSDGNPMADIAIPIQVRYKQ
jgi:hypothetical protein